MNKFTQADNVRSFAPARIFCNLDLGDLDTSGYGDGSDSGDVSGAFLLAPPAPASLSTVSPNLSVSSQYNPLGTNSASDLADVLNMGTVLGGTIASAVTGASGPSSSSPIYYSGSAVSSTPSLFSGTGLILLVAVGVGLYFLLRNK